MPGQSWPGAAASFLATWVVMMAVMMLPSLLPTLARPHRTGAGRMQAVPRPAIIVSGYLFAWTLVGAAIYPVGAMLAAVEMQQRVLGRIAPLVVASIVLAAGAWQFSDGKAHGLARWRAASHASCDCALAARAVWWRGVRLAIQCGRCCWNLMLLLLVIGMMDLRAMVVVTAAITIERLVPMVFAPRATGAVAVGAGLLLMARAIR